MCDVLLAAYNCLASIASHQLRDASPAPRPAGCRRQHELDATAKEPPSHSHWRIRYRWEQRFGD